MKKVLLLTILTMCSPLMAQTTNLQLSQFVTDIGTDAASAATFLSPSLAAPITQYATQASTDLSSGNTAAALTDLNNLAVSIEGIPLQTEYNSIIRIPVSALSGIMIVLGCDPAIVAKHQVFPTGARIDSIAYADTSDATFTTATTNFDTAWSAFLSQHTELASITRK